MDTIAPSVLSGSSSNLQTMRTGIKACTSSISSQSGHSLQSGMSLSVNFFPHRLILEKTWSRYNAFVFSSDHHQTQVTRISVNSPSSNFSHVCPPFTLVLPALEHICFEHPALNC